MEFDSLYKEYSSLVFNLALSYVQNKEDAEEITQDVFVSIHKKLCNFEKNAKYSTWIYRITINKSLDHIKAKTRKKRSGFLHSIFSEKDGKILYEPKEFNHPGIALEHKEELQEIFRLINSLPDKQKTALILHKLENKSQLEVAEIMQVSSKAVESLISRAKANLKKNINQSKGLN